MCRSPKFADALPNCRMWFVSGIRRRLRSGMSCTLAKGQTTIRLARSGLEGSPIQWGSRGWTAHIRVQRGLKQRPHIHLSKGLVQTATSYSCKSKAPKKQNSEWETKKGKIGKARSWASWLWGCWFELREHRRGWVQARIREIHYKATWGQVC